MNNKIITLTFLFGSIALASCNSGDNSSSTSTTTKDSVTIVKTQTIKEQPVTYTIAGVNYNGYVTYDSSQTDKRPAVLVVPEWWGLNDYPRMRAKMLAQLGYIAMAVDMY